MQKHIENIKQFLLEHIWDPNYQGNQKMRRLGLRTVRVLFLAGKAYAEDNLPVRASALTYFTMLSIVPVLALGFGIAKGFGLEAVLEKEIGEQLAGQKEVAEYILTFTKQMVNNAKGGLVAGIGLVVLLWSVFKLLMNIEGAFNTIWNVHSPRSVMRKFTDYFSFVLFAPLMLILSSSSTLFVTTQLNSLSQQSELLALASPAFIFLIKLIPFVIITVLFTILFMVMPNVRVHIGSAAVAGLVAGVLFQMFQSAYMYAQSYMTSYNAIYGSFAALPLFLIWLQTSWLIVLFGGELSYSIQHEHLKGTAAKAASINMHSRKKFAVRLMYVIVKRFAEGRPALDARELSKRVQGSLAIIFPLLDVLVNKGMLVKVVSDNINKQHGYSPAESLDNLEFRTVIETLEMNGANAAALLKDGECSQKFAELDALVETELKKTNSVLLKDL